jgi:hypothetical protein
MQESNFKRRNEEAPAKGEGEDLKRLNEDEDAPEVEGHGLITDAMRAKRDPEAKR